MQYLSSVLLGWCFGCPRSGCVSYWISSSRAVLHHRSQSCRRWDLISLSEIGLAGCVYDVWTVQAENLVVFPDLLVVFGNVRTLGRTHSFIQCHSRKVPGGMNGRTGMSELR
mmetsp:Transcript_8057/g.18703  ORF Transcript_8057/g.18703 Transcript_8057/m.18703 type:complete len:112 (-) Transcript_8057:1577-1912(-)